MSNISVRHSARRHTHHAHSRAHDRARSAAMVGARLARDRAGDARDRRDGRQRRASVDRSGARTRSGGAPWVVTAYTLFFGSLLLLGGRLADGFGRRRMFLIGIGTFVVASPRLGPSARRDHPRGGPRGAGDRCGADVARRAVDRHNHLRRGRANALGVWAVGGSGAAIGVALGGLLTSGPGWQWVFFVNVPIGIVVALGVTRLIAPAATTNRPRLICRGRERDDHVRCPPDRAHQRR